MHQLEQSRLSHSPLRSNLIHRAAQHRRIWLYGPIIFFVLLSAATQAFYSLNP